MFLGVVLKIVDFLFQFIDVGSPLSYLGVIFVEQILVNSVLQFLQLLLEFLQRQPYLLPEPLHIFWHLIFHIIDGQIQMRGQSVQIIDYIFILLRQ